MLEEEVSEEGEVLGIGGEEEPEVVQVAQLLLSTHHLSTHVLVFHHVLVDEHDLLVDAVLLRHMALRARSLKDILFVHLHGQVLRRP